MSNVNKYAALKSLKMPAIFAAPMLAIGTPFVVASLAQPNGISSAVFLGGLTLCGSTFLGAIGYSARPEKNNHIKEASKPQNI
jgi:hypothetical protein